MKKNLNRIILMALLCFWASACGDVYNSGSTYRVNFTCNVSFSPYNVAQSMGQFISIRKTSSSKLLITKMDGTTHTQTLTEAKQLSVYLGLGGLILGTPTLNNDNAGLVCYDLACPACNLGSARVSFDDKGIAKCASCGNQYDLNNGGILIEGKGRPLWNYRLTQSLDGSVQVHN
ncbi:MAG: hypothetical protein J5676_07500 [Bacteroidaceae bacterium]|nr:hypothetical protein [Bacteroidaceae bacterium]